MILIIQIVESIIINTCNNFLELLDFKTRRVAAFKKNLIELTELEIKHAKVSVDLFFLAEIIHESITDIYVYRECIYMFTVARGIAQEMFIRAPGRVI